MAAAGGASALLVFPPWTLAFGGHLRPEMAVAHFKAVADAADLPLICFLYPAWSNVHYPPETMFRLFEEVPGIRAVKDSPDRLDAARGLAAELDGEIREFYMTMGGYDLIFIAEFPDDATCADFVLRVGALGNIRTTTLKAYTEAAYREIIAALP